MSTRRDFVKKAGTGAAAALAAGAATGAVAGSAAAGSVTAGSAAGGTGRVRNQVTGGLTGETSERAGDRAASAAAAEPAFSLGMASYTFREFDLATALAWTARMELKYICLKSMHLPLESTPAEIEAIARQVREAGIELYGCGGVYMASETEVENAFAYAAAGGIKVMVGVPDHPLLPLVERKVREYDIKLAIHNHGPGDERYPTPESAFTRIRDMDPRMGLCIDIGHAMRSGIDPAEAARIYADRVHDIHIKDVSAASREGTTVEIGRGVIDIPRFLRTMLQNGYDGILALEHEKDGADPLAGAAESIGYLRGVLAVI